jgi:hypothetical protein
MQAKRTLQAITDAINADGGAKFRYWLGKVLPHMTDAYRGEDEGKRQHLGASQIGKECARSIWYAFRWVGEDPIALADDEITEMKKRARMLRLWNRGHLEEARFIAMLLMIGCKVEQQRNGKQLRFQSSDGHFAGSMDGIVHNLPDAMPGEPWLNEYKTYNEKRFKELVLNGVRMSDETYYVQMQIYMHKFGLRYCLFFAVNKNDDDLYAEIVEYNRETALQYMDRAHVVVHSPKPPMRIRGAGLGKLTCKWCSFKKLCLPIRGQLREVERNCRTCQWSRPDTVLGADGEPQWLCDKFDFTLNKTAQMAGCDGHSVIPDL